MKTTETHILELIVACEDAIRNNIICHVPDIANMALDDFKDILKKKLEEVKAETPLPQWMTEYEADEQWASYLCASMGELTVHHAFESENRYIGNEIAEKMSGES